MIVKMEEVTLLVSNREKESALKKLRTLGVVHIKSLKSLSDSEILRSQEKLAKTEEALRMLESFPGFGREKCDKADLAIDEIISLSDKKKRINSDLEDLDKKIKWFNIWGGFSYSSLKGLEAAGIFIRLYRCDFKILEKIAKDKPFYILARDKNFVSIALVSPDKDERLPIPEEPFADSDLDTAKKKIAEKQKEIFNIDKRLKKLSLFQQSFLEYKADLEKKIEFVQVKDGMILEQEFCYLAGFCPVDKTALLKETANANGWGYIGREPKRPEEVPTLIENPPWLRIINPVFSFMGTSPGYNEFDISFWFLLFFSLFFAMLIGDAGYGIVFLSAIFFFRRKFKKAPAEPFILGKVLSISTIIWGAVTGTWFGFEKIARLPFFNYFVIDQINSFSNSNQSFMMYICFVIGVIHLTIAHLIIAFSIINTRRALGQIGWISILWGLFFTAQNLVLNKPQPPVTVWLYVAGVSLVIFFSKPDKNFLKGALLGLADLPLTVISSFSDIVSYLRIFAVGYASVVVASSFNEMALGAGIHSVLGAFIAALVLFLGHSLNIILGFLGVIVHGIRLNMLEFSGHLDMQWSGKKYKPFKE
ncbi:MAG: hypothetical protein PHV17_05920 [Candidatus Omnitrophica bacterium]|nr:hypothetical protein [Candidatus Omnitrophota bacterium]